MYTRTLRPGEYVRIGEHEGTIVEMGMFTTRVRTGLGEELTVPNSYALGIVARNYSRTVKGAAFILDTTVTIGQAVPSDPRPRAEVLSLLHANVRDEFNENGVQIMSPHYLGDPAQAKVVPRARWNEPLA